MISHDMMFGYDASAQQFQAEIIQVSRNLNKAFVQRFLDMYADKKIETGENHEYIFAKTVTELTSEIIKLVDQKPEEAERLFKSIILEKYPAYQSTEVEKVHEKFRKNGKLVCEKIVSSLQKKTNDLIEDGYVNDSYSKGPYKQALTRFISILNDIFESKQIESVLNTI